MFTRRIVASLRKVSDALREHYNSKSTDPTDQPQLIDEVLDAGSSVRRRQLLGPETATPRRWVKDAGQTRSAQTRRTARRTRAGRRATSVAVYRSNQSRCASGRAQDEGRRATTAPAVQKHASDGECRAAVTRCLIAPPNSPSTTGSPVLGFSNSGWRMS